VQEEATKLSKRAKRRAAGEEGADADEAAEETAAAGEAVEGEADDVGDALATEPKPGGPEETELSPNRQARRTAASQARARRKREREAASAVGLDAAEMVDDALVRFTDKLGRLARRYSNALQWTFGISVIGWFGWQVYSWRQTNVNAERSDALFAAVAVEHGKTGDPSEQGKPNASGLIDPTPIFSTDAERLQAAAQAYAEAVDKGASSPAAAFARLGQAGVLLEQGKAEEARAAFEQVLGMSGAGASVEVRGNALEGRGLSSEAKGDLAGALAAFEELGSVPSFENRALFQQARVKHLQGDDGASKALLNKLFKNIGAPKAATLGGLPDRPEFLRQRATQLASVIDPFEKDVKIPKPPMGADAVQQMLEQLKESGAVTAPAPNP
jgi:predicted negative regulator of RcsB-dependent stress response